MSVTMRQMLEAGVHFGHQTRYWDPKMAPYIFGDRNKIHIINLEKTLPMFEETMKYVKTLSANKGRILFVATKRQAREIIKEEAIRADCAYVNHRWLGGMLTNFKTVKQSIKRLNELQLSLEDGSVDKITKKEALGIKKEYDKLERSIGGIKNMNSLPDAIFVIDVGYESGAVVDGDDIIFVIAHFRQKLGRLRGSVVGTTMSNLGLEEAIVGLGLGFERSGVGDRCVLEKLRDGGWSLGGEPSGHIICHDLTTTGDGLVSSLQVLQAMVESGLSLSELRKPVKKIPQVLLNVEVSEEFSLAQFPKIHRELNRISSTLGTSGRVLLRESGTEPVVRIMVEGPDMQGITSLATDLASVVESTKS